jgi:hypothetical protein
MTTLKEIEQKLIELGREKEEEKKRHEEFMQKNMAQTKKAQRHKDMLLNGIDIEKILEAEKILAIRGLKEEYDEGVVKRCIAEIASGGKALHREYFGVKNYERFIHQGSNCEYGYGPRHGYIVFSIGLKNPKNLLSNNQVEQCLYYLNVIQNAEKRAMIARS